MAKEKLTSEELTDIWKGLSEIGFSDEEINTKKADHVAKIEAEEAIEKAKKPVEEKEEKREGEDDEDSMEKAMSGIRDMYKAMEKAMTTLEDKYGKLPLVSQAKENTELKKSEEANLEKAEEAGLMKSFGDDIMKSFGEKMEEFQANIGERLEKSEQARERMEETLNEYMDSPLIQKQPLKNDYSFIEKGEKTNDDGKRVMSLSQESEEIIKCINDTLGSCKDEGDKKFLQSAISTMTIQKSMCIEAAQILQEEANIEFRR
jgi:hypothetical protein